MAGMAEQKNRGQGGAVVDQGQLSLWRDLDRRGREGLGGWEGNRDWHA